MEIALKESPRYIPLVRELGEPSVKIEIQNILIAKPYQIATIIKDACKL